MSYPKCRNCRVPARLICWECGRMLLAGVLATIVGELVVVAILRGLAG